MTDACAPAWNPSYKGRANLGPPPLFRAVQERL